MTSEQLKSDENYPNDYPFILIYIFIYSQDGLGVFTIFLLLEKNILHFTFYMLAIGSCWCRLVATIAA
jgi:hypothetical protein